MLAIGRYIFRQLFGALVFVTVVLTCTVWLTQSLRFIELIINRGLTLGAFLYLTALLLPSFLIIIVPLALASAILFVYNKLIMDSELVVLRAAGLSQGVLARPALALAACVSLFSLFETTYLLPASLRQFKEIENSIRNDYSGLLLREGVFNSLGEGFTVYLRSREANGELLGLLVHDSRIPNRPITMMAERGALVKGEDGPRVILVEGNRQEVERETGRLSLLYFDRYTVDLSTLTNQSQTRWREPSERFLSELLHPNPNDVNDVFYAKNLRAEAHHRFVAPLYPFAFALITVAALLSGEFDRRGQTRRILVAVLAVALTQAAELGLFNLASKSPLAIWLMYANPLTICLAATLLLLRPLQRRQRLALAV
ncbi:MAG: LPS export ABC transporter permease LptF [Alphaproteobacteria bacterium]